MSWTTALTITGSFFQAAISCATLRNLSRAANTAAILYLLHEYYQHFDINKFSDYTLDILVSLLQISLDGQNKWVNSVTAFGNMASLANLSLFNPAIITPHRMVGQIPSAEIIALFLLRSMSLMELGYFMHEGEQILPTIRPKSA